VGCVPTNGTAPHEFFSSYGTWNKFHSFWRGPYKVESLVGGLFSLFNLITGQTNTFHVSQLKVFVYNGIESIPLI
jgi:hypothetical protein